MFKTITAKFAGTCKRCRQPIQVGQKIRYGGRGLTYHLKNQCGQSAPVTEVIVNDAMEREAYYARREYDETCHGEMTSSFLNMEAALDNCPF